jgi:hypothetical protein
MWGANRRPKLAALEGIYEDVERESQHDSLTPAAHIKCHNLKLKLIHHMNEMCGSAAGPHHGRSRIRPPTLSVVFG